MQKIYFDCYNKTVEVNIKLDKRSEQIIDFYFYVPKELCLDSKDFHLNDFYYNISSNLFYHVEKPTPTILKNFFVHTLDDQHIALYMKSFKFFVREVFRDATIDDFKENITNIDNILNDFRKTFNQDTNFDKKLKFADEINVFYYEQSILGFLQNNPQYAQAISKVNKLRGYRKEKYNCKNEDVSDFSKLKAKEKFISDPILINSVRKRLGVMREQTVFSISAFIAMLITTIIVFRVQRATGSLSFSVLFASCIAYIFKDRFKELFRNYVLKHINRGKDQFIVTFYDYFQQNIGVVTERVQLAQPPKDVENLRQVGRFFNRDKDEEVLHYHRHYVFNKSNFSKKFDVVRNLFLIQVDDVIKNTPEQHAKYFSINEDGEVRENYIQALYDLNIIIKINEKLYRYRVKINSSCVTTFEEVNIPNQPNE